MEQQVEPRSSRAGIEIATLLFEYLKAKDNNAFLHFWHNVLQSANYGVLLAFWEVLIREVKLLLGMIDGYRCKDCDDQFRYEVWAPWHILESILEHLQELHALISGSLVARRAKVEGQYELGLAKISTAMHVEYAKSLYCEIKEINAFLRKAVAHGCYECSMCPPEVPEIESAKELFELIWRIFPDQKNSGPTSESRQSCIDKRQHNLEIAKKQQRDYEKIGKFWKNRIENNKLFGTTIETFRTMLSVRPNHTNPHFSII